MVVLPFLINTAGWLLTESGRQPWIVQGIMLTKNGLSPSVSTTELVISLTVFVLLYGTLGHRRPAAHAAVLAQGAAARASAERRRRARSRRWSTEAEPMAFVPFWFILITILWTGFFVLEGFDMGVGMLHGVIGKDEAGRRAVMSTIGPLWDGNEVWLVVAAAAMFAAFPGWYATLFSGFYLVVVLLLVRAHPARGVVRVPGQETRPRRWRRTWSRLLVGREPAGAAR